MRIDDDEDTPTTEYKSINDGDAVCMLCRRDQSLTQQHFDKQRQMLEVQIEYWRARCERLHWEIQELRAEGAK